MANPDDKEDPLISESTVELYRRTRKEAREPAKPAAQAVGALNELISLLRSAGALWRRAAEATRDAELRDRVEAEAEAMTVEVEALCSAARGFGGAPPDQPEPGGEALPFSARDLDYASDDDAIKVGLEANRGYLAEIRSKLAERPGLPDEARAAIAGEQA